MRPETPSAGCACSSFIVIASLRQRDRRRPGLPPADRQGLRCFTGCAAEPDLPQLRTAAGIDDIDCAEFRPAHQRRSGHGDSGGFHARQRKRGAGEHSRRESLRVGGQAEPDLPRVGCRIGGGQKHHSRRLKVSRTVLGARERDADRPVGRKILRVALRQLRHDAQFGGIVDRHYRQARRRHIAHLDGHARDDAGEGRHQRRERRLGRGHAGLRRRCLRLRLRRLELRLGLFHRRLADVLLLEQAPVTVVSPCARPPAAPARRPPAPGSRRAGRRQFSGRGGPGPARP